MQEEIFGPVVGFTKFDNFEEAIEIANDTDYGLTGAVITNNRENWIKAVNEFDVGNLYLNRGCTAGSRLPSIWWLQNVWYRCQNR